MCDLAVDLMLASNRTGRNANMPMSTPHPQPLHLPKLDRQISQTRHQYGQHLACTQEHPTGGNQAMVEEHAVRIRALSRRGLDWLRLEADHGDYTFCTCSPIFPCNSSSYFELVTVPSVHLGFTWTGTSEMPNTVD